jgi:murein DD-endopeptidase MepM/ murein hydrolase activator NlpD
MAYRFPLDKFKRGTAFGVKDTAHPNGHRGSDYNGFAEGTPVHAVADGVIASNQWSDVLGWVIVLSVKVGLKKQYWGYCHLHEQSHLVKGNKIKLGDVLGKAGTTGSASSGVHLHLTLGDSATSVFSGAVKDADAYLIKQIGAK